MKFMSISEIEASAIGTPTGYCDRFGTPIKVGDEIIYYHRCTRELEPDEDLSDFERYEIVGGGHKGYVYTGRVNRYRSVVTFSFEYGLRFGKLLFRKIDRGFDDRLLAVVVDNNHKSPKLTIKDIYTDLSVQNLHIEGNSEV